MWTLYTPGVQRSCPPIREWSLTRVSSAFCSSIGLVGSDSLRWLRPRSSGVRSLIMAIASTAIVPSIERWGVLVTNLGATVLSFLGALCVSLLAFLASYPSLSFDVGFYGQQSVGERSYVLMSTLVILLSPRLKRRNNGSPVRSLQNRGAAIRVTNNFHTTQ